MLAVVMEPFCSGMGERDVGAGLRRVAGPASGPLAHGAPGELEVEGWHDLSAGREVSLG